MCAHHALASTAAGSKECEQGRGEVADLPRIWKLLSGGELSAGPEPGRLGSCGQLCPIDATEPLRSPARKRGSWQCHSDILSLNSGYRGRGRRVPRGRDSRPGSMPAAARATGATAMAVVLLKGCVSRKAGVRVPRRLGLGSTHRQGRLLRRCWSHCLPPLPLRPLQDP